MPCLENPGERQVPELPDNTPHVCLVGLDVGIARALKATAGTRLDGQADLFATQPCERNLSETTIHSLSAGIASLTIALVVAIPVHQSNLDPLVQEVTQRRKILAEHKVPSLHESWLPLAEGTFSLPLQKTYHSTPPLRDL